MILLVKSCPYHFVHTILSNTTLSIYHFVHTILSVPFCPLPFCPRAVYFTHYIPETLNSIKNLILTNLVPKIVVSFQKSWLNRESYQVLHFLMFSIFYVFKERTVTCTMTSWSRSLDWSTYIGPT